MVVLDFEEVVTPEISRVLADHGARIENLERWQEKQNGTLQRMDSKIDRMSEDMHTKFDELKTLIYESREEAFAADQKHNDKRDSNLKQRITWILAWFVGVPSAIWSFIQVVSFLSKR